PWLGLSPPGPSIRPAPRALRKPLSLRKPPLRTEMAVWTTRSAGRALLVEDQYKRNGEGEKRKMKTTGSAVRASMQVPRAERHMGQVERINSVLRKLVRLAGPASPLELIRVSLSACLPSLLCLPVS